MEYSLGNIDSRFNLKNEEILAVLKDSEKTWEEPLGYDILRYNPEATFKINFIFDERQEYTQRAKEFVEEYKKLAQLRKIRNDIVHINKKNNCNGESCVIAFELIKGFIKKNISIDLEINTGYSLNGIYKKINQFNTWNLLINT